MPIPPDGIQVGQCYLVDSQRGWRVHRVVALLPDGRVQYEWRGGHRSKWRASILTTREFAAVVERPIPCDWTPESDGVG